MVIIGMILLAAKMPINLKKPLILFDFINTNAVKFRSLHKKIMLCHALASLSASGD